MTISNDGKKIIQNQLRGLRWEKKKLTDQIQTLAAERSALITERDLLAARITNLEADLGQ